MLDIFELAIIAGLIVAIVFVIKEQEKKSLISVIVLLSFMLIKNILK